ncbi:hypothetical protein B0H11DRAFT_2432540 [Mycena galericulata]|nr:hypothetical protein B0H11DRAFT_2432540 [Mycena galericulata]
MRHIKKSRRVKVRNFIHKSTAEAESKVPSKLPADKGTRRRTNMAVKSTETPRQLEKSRTEAEFQRVPRRTNREGCKEIGDATIWNGVTLLNTSGVRKDDDDDRRERRTRIAVSHVMDGTLGIGCRRPKRLEGEVNTGGPGRRRGGKPKKSEAESSRQKRPCTPVGIWRKNGFEGRGRGKWAKRRDAESLRESRQVIYLACVGMDTTLGEIAAIHTAVPPDSALDVHLQKSMLKIMAKYVGVHPATTEPKGTQNEILHPTKKLEWRRRAGIVP